MKTRFEAFSSKTYALGLSLLLAGCALQMPDTRAADEAAIQEADEQWAKTASGLNVDGTVAYYTDDAALLPPNGPIATTKADIRANWAALLAPGNSIAWKVSKVDVARSGDLGYTYGSYTLNMKDPSGAMIHDKGKFMEVWRKQADNKWKCVADTFNSDLPLPAPAPAGPTKKK